MKPSQLNMSKEKYEEIHTIGRGELTPTPLSELRGDNRELTNKQQGFTTINAEESRKNGPNAANGKNQLRPGDPTTFTTRMKAKPEIAAEDRSDWGELDSPTQKSGDSVHSAPKIKNHDWRNRGYKTTLREPYKHADLSHTPTAKKRKLPTVE
jgi:hypothetical protein